MTRARLSLIVSIGSVALLCAPSRATAQTAPSLGAAQTFAVLGGTSVKNTGPSVINGDLGISPGVASSITGIGTATITGVTYAGPLTLAGNAQTSRNAALGILQGEACSGPVIGAVPVGVQTFGPGVYCYSSTFLLNGPITFDAGGDPNAVFIVNVGSSLTTATFSQVLLAGGAQACNIFWAITQDATIEVSSLFVGNLIVGRDLVAKTGAQMFGRALAARDLTLDSNTVNATVCAGVAGGGACVPATTPPTITAIPSQVIPAVPTNGTVAVGFSVSGAVIPSALRVTATSSNQTLVGQDDLVITGTGSARVLTIRGANGRTGVTTITVTVTDPTVATCSTSTSFQLTIGAAVPTLPQWAMIVLTALLALAGFATIRRRAT